MTAVRKDLAATLLTSLAVLVYFANREGWSVPLVGDSRRWAAAVVLAVGWAACALGSPGKGRLTRVLAALGTLALAFGVIALVTGSPTWLSLLVADIAVLWAVATFRHLRREHARPVAA
jgi:hypothetical protein